MIDQPVRDRPVLCEPGQPARSALELIYVGRCARRRTPTTSGRVVALAVSLVVIPRHAVPAVDDVVPLEGIDALVEHRAATRERRCVVEHRREERIVDGRLFQDLARDRAPHRLRDDVPLERVAHDGVSHLARGPGVVDLPEDDRPAHRVGPDHLAGFGVAGERRIEQLAEVALLEPRRRERDEPAGAEVAHARDLQVGEEERLVAPVVNLRDVDRPTDRVTPVEELERRPPPIDRVVVEVIGPEGVVLDVAERGAVQLVRARLDGEVGDACQAARVLGRHRSGLKLELRDGIGRRAELVVGTALQVEAAERYALDQDLVGIVLSPVDRALEGSADRAR